MKQQEQEIVFFHKCVKCNKLMIQSDGTTMGGMTMHSIVFDNKIVLGTTCWQCFLENPEDN